LSRGTVSVRRDDPQVAPATRLVATLTTLVREVLMAGWWRRSRRFTDRLGERHQIIGGGRRRRELASVPNQLPTTWGGQAPGVGLTQVVRVRLGESGERTDDSGGLVIDIGQRGYGLAGAAVSGATPW
jgi:hypothetical protein